MRYYLNAHEEHQCCELLLDGIPMYRIANRFKVGRSTIHDITIGATVKKHRYTDYLKKLRKRVEFLINDGKPDDYIFEHTAITPSMLQVIRKRLALSSNTLRQQSLDKVKFKIGDIITVLEGEFKGTITEVLDIMIVSYNTNIQYLKILKYGREQFILTPWCEIYKSKIRGPLCSDKIK